LLQRSRRNKISWKGRLKPIDFMLDVDRVFLANGMAALEYEMQPYL